MRNPPCLVRFVTQANHEDNEYFDAQDMGRHPRLLKDHIVMSSAIISQVERKNFDADCITKVLAASENDQEWQERREELERLENKGKEFPNNWQSSEGLLYYKNRLYISEDDKLQTLIAKKCHDSQVPGHFGQDYRDCN